MAWWPLIRLLPQKTSFTYVKFAAFAAFLSIAAVTGSLVSMVTGGFRENPIAIFQETEGSALARVGGVLERGFNLGIDFKGGTSVLIEAAGPIDQEALRGLGGRLQDGSVEVQGTTCRPVDAPPFCVLLNFESTEGGSTLVESLRGQLSSVAPGGRIVNVDVVGGKVSEELFAGGLIALGLAILLMLIYIWFRFEWQFGLGGVLALFHDVILTLGLFSVFRINFDLTIIAALLTIISIR